MENLALKERIKNIINLGESHFREFKSAFQGTTDNKTKGSVKELSKYIAEALVGFANADGGAILIGVEDNGFVTGLPHNEDEINNLLVQYCSYLHEDSQLPIEISTKLTIFGHKILFFSVSKGSDQIYQLSDGRCVKRRDKQTIPVSFQKIHFERQEILSREYDRNFVDGATVNDLDINFLQSISTNYLSGLSVEFYLQQIGLAEYETQGLRLRRAALLLFAKDITKWHSRSQVRILQIEGNELKSGKEYNVINDETVSGNIFQLLNSSWEKIRPFLAYKTEFGEGGKFEQRFVYPEEAIREALVNAITHRDYMQHNGIEIFIFIDRLEIRSPGLLLSTISLKDLQQLKGLHESRNSLIAKVLRENKIVRELGEGIKRIFNLLQSEDMEAPDLLNESNSFSIILKNKTVYSAKEEGYLNLFQKLNLTKNQKRILTLGLKSKEIAPVDIYTVLNTDDRNIYDKEVTGLRKIGVLVEVRKNQEAGVMSKKLKVDKQKIGRFKINIPD